MSLSKLERPEEEKDVHVSERGTTSAHLTSQWVGAILKLSGKVVAVTPSGRGRESEDGHVSLRKGHVLPSTSQFLFRVGWVDTLAHLGKPGPKFTVDSAR